MRLLTLNTWGRSEPYLARRERIAQEIATLDVDLCCLQEVFDDDLLEALRSATALEHQCTDPRTGLAIASRWPIRSERILHYRSVSPREGFYRGALLCRIELDVGDLLVACTHLSFRPVDASVRRAQVQSLLAALEPIELPRILAGDFNEAPDGSAIELVRTHGFLDTFAARNPGVPGFTWDQRNPYTVQQDPPLPDRRIDYMFVDSMLADRLGDSRIVLDRPDEHGVFPSDHAGVLVELSPR